MESTPVRKGPVVKTLDPAKKALWLAALRSGGYKQGKLFLHKDGRFCCLGVYIKAVEGRLPVADETTGANPYDHLQEVGIDTSYCIEMNDYDHRSFPQIADWIEENL